MTNLLINSSITHTLLLVLPVACALLLRWARWPGWAVTGGIIAGVLLGPSVLGRLAPEAFEKAFIGGVEQREDRDDLLRRQGADLVAQGAAGADAAARADLAARHAKERAPLDAAYAEAKWHHQRPTRSYVFVFAALVMAGTALERGGRRDPRQGAVTAASIGLWAACVPGGLAAAAVIAFGWGDRPAALAVAAAVGIGPWLLAPGDRLAAERAETGGARLLAEAGRVSTVIAIAAALVVLLALGPHLDLSVGLLAAGLLAAPTAWLALLRRNLAPGAARLVTAVLRGGAVPVVAALAVLYVDVLASARLWPIVLLLLLADARALGALLGAMVPGGRRTSRTMRLVLGSAACAPTQLAVAAVCAHAWVMPPAVTLGLAAGAIYLDASTPLRRRLAEDLEAVEETLE